MTKRSMEDGKFQQIRTRIEKRKKKDLLNLSTFLPSLSSAQMRVHYVSILKKALFSNKPALLKKLKSKKKNRNAPCLDTVI